MTLKATGATTTGSLVLLENLTSPGGGPPPHIHTREDESFFVLDGMFEIRIGEEIHTLGAGGYAYVPRGTVHSLRNIAETASRILVGFTPAGMEGFFREAGQPAVDDGPAPRLMATRSHERWPRHRSTESRRSPSTNEIGCGRSDTGVRSRRCRNACEEQKRASWAIYCCRRFDQTLSSLIFSTRARA